MTGLGFGKRAFSFLRYINSYIFAKVLALKGLDLTSTTGVSSSSSGTAVSGSIGSGSGVFSFAGSISITSTGGVGARGVGSLGGPYSSDSVDIISSLSDLSSINRLFCYITGLGIGTDIIASMLLPHMNSLTF